MCPTGKNAAADEEDEVDEEAQREQRRREREEYEDEVPTTQPLGQSRT